MSDQDEQARARRHAWNLLGIVKDHPQIQLWLQEADASDSTQLPQRATARWSRRRVTWACAATVALVVAMAFTLQILVAPPRYETRIGEQRDVLLADGSRVTLNTATSLTVRYSNKRRHLDLERGEALFTVKHDAARPFDVTSGGIVTRALGTEFNVDVRSNRIVVSVLDGVVRVAAISERDRDRRDGAAPHHANVLTRGQALQYSPNDHAFKQTQAELNRIAAWRTRRLEFSNTPFVEAIEEFNRYSATRLTIGTPELRDVRVGGVFRIGDTEGFLFSLQEALHIDAHQSGDEIVLVRRSM